MIVGSDYDGTYPEHPEIWDEVDFIVTGRTWKQEIDGKDVYCPVFLNPDSTASPTLTSVVTHKAHILNQTHADRFYEDQEEQAELLKILCPQCTIVLIR